LYYIGPSGAGNYFLTYLGGRAGHGGHLNRGHGPFFLKNLFKALRWRRRILEVDRAVPNILSAFPVAAGVVAGRLPSLNASSSINTTGTEAGRYRTFPAPSRYFVILQCSKKGFSGAPKGRPNSSRGCQPTESILTKPEMKTLEGSTNLPMVSWRCQVPSQVRVGMGDPSRVLSLQHYPSHGFAPVATIGEVPSGLSEQSFDFGVDQFRDVNL
jgi:hypothetical protein